MRVEVLWVQVDLHVHAGQEQAGSPGRTAGTQRESPSAGARRWGLSRLWVKSQIQFHLHSQSVIKL